MWCPKNQDNIVALRCLKFWSICRTREGLLKICCSNSCQTHTLRENFVHTSVDWNNLQSTYILTTITFSRLSMKCLGRATIYASNNTWRQIHIGQLTCHWGWQLTIFCILLADGGHHYALVVKMMVKLSFRTYRGLAPAGFPYNVSMVDAPKCVWHCCTWQTSYWLPLGIIYLSICASSHYWWLATWPEYKYSSFYWICDVNVDIVSIHRTPSSTKWKGAYWYHLVRLSFCPYIKFIAHPSFFIAVTFNFPWWYSECVPRP